MLSSWLRSLLNRQSQTSPRRHRTGARQRGRQRQRSVQLHLEQLEDRITPSGPTLSTLASFNGSNGAGPLAGVIRDSSGNLYGTTQGGGASSDGTVFELAAGSSTITTLARFNGTNGADVVAGLIMDSSGNLYGTTAAGGASNDGTVFELAAGSGTITTLASFDGTNGAGTTAGLIRDGSGNLYGTTQGGGASNNGTVFELAAGSSTITTLASFNPPPTNVANGVDPVVGLIMDGSGNLYGTTFQGGASGNYGTVFELAAGSGTITTLASFNNTNGADPATGLIMDSNGNLYGTTAFGGASSDGTVFELAAGSSTITTLASFNGTNGAEPFYGALTMDSNGNLYGTTAFGGASSDGTVFELAAGSSTITTLASFNSTNNPANGALPYGGVIMDSSGNLYGTTSAGGASGDGTVFELQTAAASQLAFTTAAQTLTAGVASGTITVQEQDQFGNAVNAGSGGLTVMLSSSDATGTFLDTSGNPLTGNSVTIASGQSSVSFEYADTKAGTPTITASASGLTNASQQETVNPAATSKFLVRGFPSPVTAGVAATFTVTAQDAFGNTTPAYGGTVHFTSSDAQATLPANYAFTSSDAGAHSFSATLKTAGSQSITATDTITSGITGSQSNILVNPAAATHFRITGPTSVVHGTAFSITVTALDTFGNIATGYRGTVKCASSDNSAVLPNKYTFTASDNGVHTFAGLVLRKKGRQTITVFDAANSAIQGIFSINVL